VSFGRGYAKRLFRNYHILAVASLAVQCSSCSQLFLKTCHQGIDSTDSTVEVTETNNNNYYYYEVTKKKKIIIIKKKARCLRRYITLVKVEHRSRAFNSQNDGVMCACNYYFEFQIRYQNIDYAHNSNNIMYELVYIQWCSANAPTLRAPNTSRKRLQTLDVSTVLGGRDRTKQ
jgi:hypothetical protein